MIDITRIIDVKIHLEKLQFWVMRKLIKKYWNFWKELKLWLKLYDKKKLI